jgi:hypothetical protein
MDGGTITRALRLIGEAQVQERRLVQLHQRRSAKLLRSVEQDDFRHHRARSWRDRGRGTEE